MAKVDLMIGGHAYTVACRDGEEARLAELASLVDGKAQDARRALGGVSEARQLLFAALLLADDLDETRRKLTGGSHQRPSRMLPLRPKMTSICWTILPIASKAWPRALSSGAKAPIWALADTARCALMRLSLRRFHIHGGCPCPGLGLRYMVPT